MKVTRNAVKRISNPYKKRKASNDTIDSESGSDTNSISKQTRKSRAKAMIVSPDRINKVKAHANEASKKKQITPQTYASPQMYVSDVDTSHDEYKDEKGKTIGTLYFNQNYLINNLLNVKFNLYIMYKSN